MIKNFKLFESKSKGKEILYTFKTKAKINNGKKEYTVHILDSNDNYNLGKYIISIDGSPGAWYVDTFLENRNDIIHLMGNEWVVTGGFKIYDELVYILPKLEKIKKAKKYNII